MGAFAVMLGMDLTSVIDRGKEDHMINVAVMRKALELRAEEKVDELTALSQMIAMEFAKIF